MSLIEEKNNKRWKKRLNHSETLMVFSLKQKEEVKQKYNQ